MQKYNLRKEIINAAMDSLKIDKNPFNYSTIEDFIVHIEDKDLKSFYSSLFGNEHNFLNGMDRIAKVAEQLKPIEIDDETTAKAKRLIQFCETANTDLDLKAKEEGINLTDYLKDRKIPLADVDLTILNNIKGDYDYKQVIIHIRTFGNALDTINAFKRAILQTERIGGMIENKVTDRLRINR